MTGVRATDADYVFALDADDLLAAGAVRRLSDALDQHPEAAAAWGSVSSFGAVEHGGDRSRSSLDPWELTYQNHLPLSCLYRRSHIAYGSGLGMLVARYRAHRVLRGS
jgi:Glycosyl transferase family 2